MNVGWRQWRSRWSTRRRRWIPTSGRSRRIVSGPASDPGPARLRVVGLDEAPLGNLFGGEMSSAPGCMIERTWLSPSSKKKHGRPWSGPGPTVVVVVVVVVVVSIRGIEQCRTSLPRRRRTRRRMMLIQGSIPRPTSSTLTGAGEGTMGILLII